jgi:hypothetical protein
VAVIAMVSAKGSPGVSTAALAFTLSWSGRILLAECDPVGGDILAGYLATVQVPGDHGLLRLAQADLREQMTEQFWGQLIDLDAPYHRRLVLPGLTDPAQASALRPTWARLAGFLAGLEYADPGYDVIVDCGRLAVNTPWPLLARADLVLLVLRAGSLRDISPAYPAQALLRRHLAERPEATLGLLLIGAGGQSHREIERALRLPVIARLPEDRRTADALCGIGALRGSRDLLRHAASVEEAIRAAVARQRAQAGEPAAVATGGIHSGA